MASAPRRSVFPSLIVPQQYHQALPSGITIKHYHQAGRERRRRETSQGPSVTVRALTQRAFGVEKKRPKTSQPSAPPTSAAPAPRPTVHHPGCASPRPYAPSPQRATCASQPTSAPSSAQSSARSSAQSSVNKSRSTSIILRSSPHARPL